MAAKSFVNQEIEVIDDSGTKKVLLTKLLLWYKKDFGQNDNEVLDKLRCGSCHFDRASNDEFSVEFWIFVIVAFFNRSRVLKFGAPSRYYKSDITQKR